MVTRRLKTNDEECSQIYAFIKIPSFVALISDKSSTSIYFVKKEEKEIYENMMGDSYGHTLKLNSINTNECEDTVTPVAVWLRI